MFVSWVNARQVSIAPVNTFSIGVGTYQDIPRLPEMWLLNISIGNFGVCFFFSSRFSGFGGKEGEGEEAGSGGLEKRFPPSLGSSWVPFRNATQCMLHIGQAMSLKRYNPSHDNVIHR